jgi:hypothetical protein
VLHARNGKKTSSKCRLKPASSYPGVRLALVVGICGGAPSPLNHQEIFLGDMGNSDMVIELLNTILDGKPWRFSAVEEVILPGQEAQTSNIH